MKLTASFEKLLQIHFQEVIVIDERGDGHYIEMIMIDNMFTNKTRLERSRLIFEKLGNFTKQVHAFSVRGFTFQEWKTKKESFHPTRYVHIEKNLV